MSTVRRYDPPANMTDFDSIEGQRDQWSAAVSGWFDECIEAAGRVLAPGDTCQYYNQLKTRVRGPVVEQVVVWNGLSGTLRSRHGRRQALEMSEHLFPLTQRMDRPEPYFVGGQWENLYYRPQDEYCEWRTVRDAHGRITKVVFTSEPPEYWQALHGDTLPDTNGEPRYKTTGDPELLVDLYREYVSEDVRYEDLICQEDLVDQRGPNPKVVFPKGSYNPYNRWNTRDGIMHLSHPNNTLAQEIQLGADATVLRRRAGRPVTDPNELICCSAYGGPMRTSDPTIGSSVNKLADLGFYVTLRNPVGLYMHHIDLTGITTPAGNQVGEDYFKVLRGNAKTGMIERAEFAVPPGHRNGGRRITVSDLCVGGAPITHGGQIAERITVSLVGQAAEPGRFRNQRVECQGRCYQDPHNGNFILLKDISAPPPPLTPPAFDYPPWSDG